MKLIIDIPYEAYYTFQCELGKGNLNALAEIIANGKPYEETQGEWGEVFHHQGYNYHKCPKCCFGIKLADYDNFCPNCGAKMMKGGSE